MIVDYNWTDDILDVDDYKELRAFQNAQLDAIRRARQFDTEFIILLDDKVFAEIDLPPRRHFLTGVKILWA